MTQKPINEMTEAELKSQLLTNDYGGKEMKEACLVELLKRQTKS